MFQNLDISYKEKLYVAFLCLPLQLEFIFLKFMKHIMSSLPPLFTSRVNVLLGVDIRLDE
jgi:hypothetical protein